MPDASREVEMALFEAASLLSENTLRRRFLDQACQGRPDLRARLERLLAASAAAPDFFDLPAPSLDEVIAARHPVTAASASVDPLAQSDTHIGRYRLLHRIGEGGCGVVYLAEQQEPLTRHVALKIIRLGMDTERVVARFELERQSLALLNHPHIAQVLDAGATPSGRPYFVMELVDGAPITEYCDRERLPIRERLRLFVQVCHAIQHAHQKGILHRDIKPSNVLIAAQPGSAPAPKVIDFGVAKAFTEGPAGSATFIDGEQFIGTPAYMSPEQAAPGRFDVDTRTDIYGLGALLHELLAGRPPFESKTLLSSGLDQLRRTLLEVEPPRPSRLLRSLPAPELARLAGLQCCTPRDLVQTLRRDLDWIIIRTLEKDPARRYATVNGLALDIDRYLRDDPIDARPPSRAYRLRKFVRKNRVAVAASVAVSLATFAGLGTSTVLYVREREALRQQTELRRQAETSERLTRAAFLTREGNFTLASAVLDSVPLPIRRASFDGVVAYRAVGDWLASERRWAEAAARFAIALEVGRLDSWGPVTVDHQSFGVATLLAGQEDAYARFRRESAARFTPATSTDAAARALKTCLLRPLDARLREQLLPIGQRTVFWVNSLNPRLASGWAAVTVCLWQYRIGEYGEAARLASLTALDERATPSGARAATLDLVLALCDARKGRADSARSRLERVRPILNAAFQGDLTRGDSRSGYWYDWAYAAILLTEADALVQSPPPPANTP
jgi:serine/threonine protein kinase